MVIACGIDIGTNSFRLQVAEVRDGCLYPPLAHDLVTVRLGEGFGDSGLLAPAAMLRGEAALARFAGIMAAYPLHSVRTCATHAVRKATNRDEFLHRAKALIGQVEVLSGEEEARLALLGALSALPEDLRRYPMLLVDVGGGSTELILQATAGNEPRVLSLPLGAVGLTEEFAADCAAMREKIRAILLPALRSIAAGEMLGQDVFLVASGGTATSLAALALGLDRYDAQQVQNYQLSQATVHRQVAWLATLSPTERNALPGLADGRGEIILAGAVLLQELQQALASPVLVSDAGLLEGILLSGTIDS